MNTEVRQQYREQTRRVIENRLPLSALLFVVGIGSANLLEYFNYPERLPQLLLASGLELSVWLAVFAADRLGVLERWTIQVTHVLCTTLVLCVLLYFLRTNADPVTLAFVLIVFVLTPALIFPWGLWNQMLLATVNASAYITYLLHLYWGPGVGEGALPAEYGVAAVTAAAGFSVVGAYLLDEQRLSVFAHRDQLDRHLATFRDLTHAFHGFNPPRVLLLTCTSTLHAFGLHRLWVAWKAPGSRAAVGYFAERKGDETAMTALADARSLTRELARTDRSAVAFVGNPDDSRLPHPLWLSGVRTFLFMPLRFEDETLGGLWADRGGEPFTLDSQQLELASVLASAAAIAMGNARLHERIRSISNEKSTFLARIAHELRNPLHAILWDLDTLLKQASQRHPILERLRQNTLTVVDAAQELEDFAEIETKRLTSVAERLRIEETLDDLRPMAEALLADRPITFETSVAPGAEEIVTDPARLRQILGNLISNAAKFTNEGRISVEAERFEDGIAIRVRDTGVGIDARDLDAIFEPFNRGSSRSVNPTRGMGLGLAIAQEIATLLRGRIEVETTLGKGSVFSLMLPVGEVQSAEETRRAPGTPTWHRGAA